MEMKVVAYPMGEGQWVVVCDGCGPVSVAPEHSVDFDAESHFAAHEAVEA